jgi:hypothetical protein
MHSRRTAISLLRMAGAASGNASFVVGSVLTLSAYSVILFELVVIMIFKYKIEKESS